MSISFQDHAGIVVELLNSFVPFARADQINAAFVGFNLFIVATSFRKMLTRVRHLTYSEKYYVALLSAPQGGQLSYSLIQDHSNDQKLMTFLDAKFIPQVLKEVQLPWLMNLARQMRDVKSKEDKQNIFQSTILPSFYSSEGYREFQVLLRTVLQNYRSALEELERFHPTDGLKRLSSLVTLVMINGWALRAITYSNIFEEHLNITRDYLSNVLKANRPTLQSESVPDTAEVTANVEAINLDEAGTVGADEEDSELAAVQIDSVHNGHLLSAQSSCKNWLRLQVSYFEATDILTKFVRRELPGATAKRISMKIVALHHPGLTMLPLNELIPSIIPSSDPESGFTPHTVWAVLEELAKDYRVFRKLLHSNAFKGTIHCEATLASLLHCAPTDIQDANLRRTITVSYTYRIYSIL